MSPRPSIPPVPSLRDVKARSVRLRRTILAALLVAGSMPGLGCGGDDPPAPIEDVCVEFAPDQAPQDGTLTPVMVEESTCERIFVELVVTGVNDVFGVNTVLTYDPTIVRYRSWSNAESFLRSDGSEVAALIEENTTGEVTIGMARVADTGVTVDGGVSESLILLEFDIARSSAATGALTLRANCLLGSEDPPEPIQGVTCVGGTVVVR